MHNPFTRWIISLYLSCHVSDHAQTQDGDEAGSADIDGTHRYIHHAAIQILNNTLFQIDKSSLP